MDHTFTIQCNGKDYTVKVFDNCVQVVNSYEITKKEDIKKAIEDIKAELKKSECPREQNLLAAGDNWFDRIFNNYVVEWKAHNRLYKLGLFKSHTKDVDLGHEIEVLMCDECVKDNCWSIEEGDMTVKKDDISVEDISNICVEVNGCLDCPKYFECSHSDEEVQSIESCLECEKYNHDDHDKYHHNEHDECENNEYDDHDEYECIECIDCERYQYCNGYEQQNCNCCCDCKQQNDKSCCDYKQQNDKSCYDYKQQNDKSCCGCGQYNCHCCGCDCRGRWELKTHKLLSSVLREIGYWVVGIW